jgi:hypothetical protein
VALQLPCLRTPLRSCSRAGKSRQEAGLVIPPAARTALEHAWVAVLTARHPEFRWTLLRPGERGERNTATSAGEIVGTLTAPEDENALLERNGATGATNGANHDGIDGGGD